MKPECSLYGVLQYSSTLGMHDRHFEMHLMWSIIRYQIGVDVQTAEESASGIQLSPNDQIQSVVVDWYVRKIWKCSKFLVLWAWLGGRNKKHFLSLQRISQIIPV